MEAAAFLETVVVFRSVLAGNEREALLRVLDQLSVELGYAAAEEAPGARSGLSGEGGVMSNVLSPADDLLVRSVRGGLARVAAAAARREPGGSIESAISAALDGSEMVIRGELVSGNAAKLPALMPSFVFLVALPVVDQDRALELSRRTEQLVERALASSEE